MGCHRPLWGAALLSPVPPIDAPRAAALGVFPWLCLVPAARSIVRVPAWGMTHQLCPPSTPPKRAQCQARRLLPIPAFPDTISSTAAPALGTQRRARELSAGKAERCQHLFAFNHVLLLRGTRVCARRQRAGSALSRQLPVPSLPVPGCAGSCSPSASLRRLHEVKLNAGCEAAQAALLMLQELKHEQHVTLQ